MEDVIILPCPFCGSPLYEDGDLWMHQDGLGCWLDGQVCIDNSEDDLCEASKMWNARANLQIRH